MWSHFFWERSWSWWGNDDSTSIYDAKGFNGMALVPKQNLVQLLHCPNLCVVGTGLHHCWPFLQAGKTAGQQTPDFVCSQAKGHLLCPCAALLGPPEGKGSFSSRSGPMHSFWAQSQKQLSEACWQRPRWQTPLLHSYNCCCWNITLVLNQLQWNRRLWENKLLSNISLTSFPLVALLLSRQGFTGHFVF